MSEYKSSDKYQITLLRYSDGSDTYSMRLIGNIQIDKGDFEDFKEVSHKDIDKVLAEKDIRQHLKGLNINLMNTRYNLGRYRDHYVIFKGQYQTLSEIEGRPYGYIPDDGFILDMKGYKCNKIVFVSDFKPVKLTEAVYEYLEMLITGKSVYAEMAIKYLLQGYDSGRQE